VRKLQPVTSDTALRRARVFGTTAEFWMNLHLRERIAHHHRPLEGNRHGIIPAVGFSDSRGIPVEGGL